MTFYISGAKVSTWSSQPDPNRRHKLKLGHESVMRVRETASGEIRNLGHLQDSQNRNNGQWGVHRNGYNYQPHTYSSFLLQGMAGTKAEQKKNIVREKRESSNYKE